MDLASGPPQQDSHVFMPHNNSAVWLCRIRCDTKFMNGLIFDDILWIFGWVWMKIRVDVIKLFSSNNGQWLLVYLMVDPKEWHHCQNKPLSIYMTVYCDTDCINTHTSNNALVFVVFIFHTSFSLLLENIFCFARQ